MSPVQRISESRDGDKAIASGRVEGNAILTSRLVVDSHVMIRPLQSRSMLSYADKPVLTFCSSTEHHVHVKGHQQWRAEDRCDMLMAIFVPMPCTVMVQDQ